MALKPTIYKAQVNLADSDRDCYEALTLTLARHPSETLERMTVRLLAYCLHADPQLQFTRGLSSTDEPDLWRHDDSGVCLQWLEVGQPEPTRLRKACGRAQAVVVYAFGQSADTWWRGASDALTEQKPLQVWQFDWQEVCDAAELISRNSKLNVSIAGGTLYMDNGEAHASLTPQILLDALT
jgi:uncharacterized protein YaeQ